MQSMNYYLICSVMNVIMTILFMLVSVAFVTLLERKSLSYIQDRKGPNKLGFLGLLQPFSDMIKLFSKEFMLLKNINIWVYMMMPAMILLFSMLMWLIFPFYSNSLSMNNGILFMISIMCLGVYPVMLGGWASNSSYSMLGAIRSVSQSISYEVSLFLILLSLLILVEGFSMNGFLNYQKDSLFIIFLFPVYLMFVISMLIELNRAPFDLVEGESELVSGFNIEYFSSFFAMIFMAEYLSIVFVSFFTTFFFFGLVNYILFCLIYLFHLFFIIWIRGVMPRMRYDQLMYMCWKSFLSISLLFVMYVFGIKELLNFVL